MAKIRITMKDPDGAYDSIQAAAERSVAAIEGVDAEERHALIDERKGRYAKALGRWLRYGEYLTVDFDTDAGTATVVEER